MLSSMYIFIYLQLHDTTAYYLADYHILLDRGGIPS